jgi:hypothetical protein
MSTEIDVTSGIKTKWDSSHRMNLAMPSSRLRDGTVEGGVDMPYGTIAVVPEKEPDFVQGDQPGAPVIEHVKITVSIYDATKADVGSVVDALRAEFNTEFDIPNSKCMEWHFVSDAIVELPAEQRKDGSPSYRGDVIFGTMLQRTLP